MCITTKLTAAASTPVNSAYTAATRHQFVMSVGSLTWGAMNEPCVNSV
jgi:hypothetical protein